MSLSDVTRKKLSRVVKEAYDEGVMMWGFLTDDDGNFEAYTNQEWNEHQICAATVEAIQNINPDFVKEA